MGWGVYLVPGGVYLVPGGVPGPRGCTWSWGGVPGPRGCTWSRGDVPGPGGCTWSRGVPGQVLHPVNRMTNRCKNITLPQTSFAGGNK